MIESRFWLRCGCRVTYDEPVRRHSAPSGAMSMPCMHHGDQFVSVKLVTAADLADLSPYQPPIPVRFGQSGVAGGSIVPSSIDGWYVVLDDSTIWREPELRLRFLDMVADDAVWYAP